MAIGHTYFFYELSAIFNVFGFSFFISQLGLMIFALSFELQEKKKKRTASVPCYEFQKTSD